MAINSEQALHHDGIDSEKHRTGFGEANEDRLVAGAMTGGFYEGDTGEKILVAIDRNEADARKVPVGACAGKARVAAAGEGEVGTLDDKFGVGESVVVAAVVDIEVRADNSGDVGGAEL